MVPMVRCCVATDFTFQNKKKLERRGFFWGGDYFYMVKEKKKANVTGISEYMYI